MTSTISSDEILKLSKVNLVFQLRYYEERSMRDLFVKLARDPAAALRARDHLHVLKDIDLTLRRGDRLALMGVNGSGKTSLCRCIAGMLHPVRGKVRIQGTTRAIFNTHAGIIPELTGQENARLLARFLYPTETRTELDNMVDDALEFSELGSFLHTPYETYSQGMKARLCLSLITARPADLLILDEVYDNTDQFFQRKMASRLESFIERSGAVIFVSHSPAHIRSICNRAVILQKSRVAFDGSVAEALDHYESLNAAHAPSVPAV